MLNEKNTMKISESTQRQKERRKRRKSSLPEGYVKDKIDELLIRFMSLPETQKRLQEEFDKVKRNELTLNDLTTDHSEPKSPRPPSPNSLPSPRGDSADNTINVRRSSSFSSSQSKINISVIKSVTESQHPSIPRFHFPFGNQNHNNEAKLDQQIEYLYNIFPKRGGGDLSKVENFCEFVNIPRNWRKIICYAAAREDNLPLLSEIGDLIQPILPATIEKLWRKVHHIPPGETLFIRLLTGGLGQLHIDNSGLMIFVLDLIFTVKSLKFLQSASEFFEPYCITVIQRLAFHCRAWNKTITKNQLEKSEFLSIVEDISHENGDINNDHNFFSYEHFYVIYCKFFELDLSKQMSLSRLELSRYGCGGHVRSGINPLVFTRVFLLRRYPEVSERIKYEDFIWFILSEEDKTNPVSIEYWFYILDQDGDGVISMYDLEQFYSEIYNLVKLEDTEPINFADKLTDVLDRLAAVISVIPENLRSGIHLSQLRKSKEVAQPILDTFLNAEKYIESDQNGDIDPKPDSVETEWEKFAQKCYSELIDEPEETSTYDQTISAYNDSNDLMI